MADNDCSDNREHPSDQDLEGFVNFAPAISDEEMKRLDHAASTKERGVQRRLCLVACARSADDLSKLSTEEPKAFDEMLGCIEAFKEHAKGLAEISETAYLRMMMADCRDTRTAE